MVDREEDVRTRSIANSRLIVSSKYHKTSNASRVSSTTWVSIWCQLIIISGRFVWNNYDKIAWIRHKISVTKQTVSKLKGLCSVYAITYTFIYRKNLQESYAVAKMTARCALYRGALNFRDSLTTPTATIPNIFIVFCSDRPYECSYKMWSP